MVLLGRQADHAGLTGLFERGFPDEAPYRSFRYEVARVWQMPAEAFLGGGLGTLPLAPLSDVREQDLAGVIRRMETRINGEAAAEEKGRLWTATGILMSIRYGPDLVDQLLRRVFTMEESTYYQFIMRKGAVKELQKVLLRLGRARFGPASEPVEAAVTAVVELDQLERLTERVLLVSSWDELLASP